MTNTLWLHLEKYACFRRWVTDLPTEKEEKKKGVEIAQKMVCAYKHGRTTHSHIHEPDSKCQELTYLRREELGERFWVSRSLSLLAKRMIRVLKTSFY